MAVSRPEPAPLTNTSPLRMPCSMARRAAASAACWAAYGVDLREPLNPTCPEDAHEITFPVGSVIETMVLLNVDRMWACPWATFFRSLRRTFLAAPWLRLFGGICFLTPEVVTPDEVRIPRRGGGGGSPTGLLPTGLLLAGDGLLLALAGTRVRLRPLAVHRQPPAVPD